MHGRVILQVDVRTKSFQAASIDLYSISSSLSPDEFRGFVWCFMLFTSHNISAMSKIMLCRGRILGRRSHKQMEEGLGRGGGRNGSQFFEIGYKI